MKEMHVLDRELLKGLIRRRRKMGVDQRDEVWDGVYVIMPLGDIEHQELIGELTTSIRLALGEASAARVFPGVNVTDQPGDWEKNFRCPDVAVYCPGNPAEARGFHWLGGPDLAVEIISPNDRSRKRFDFYAAVNVRELLLVSRKPWRLELHRRHESEWVLVGKSTVDNPDLLTSEALSLTFRLVPGPRRPQIEVARKEGNGDWLA